MIIIPMPIDKEGNGPICDGTEDKVMWEIWDDDFQTIFCHEDRSVVEAEFLRIKEECTSKTS